MQLIPQLVSGTRPDIVYAVLNQGMVHWKALVNMESSTLQILDIKMVIMRNVNTSRSIKRGLIFDGGRVYGSVCGYRWEAIWSRML